MSASTPSDVPALTLKYAQTTNRALGVACKVIQQKQAEKKAALAHVPSAVKLLQDLGYIDADQAKMASDRLGSHDGAAEVLVNVLQEVKKAAEVKAASELGQPVSASTLSAAGSAHQKNANYAGYRRGEGERHPADASMLALIGK